MMKKNLTKIISSIAIPLMVAGGLYLSTPEYSYAGNNKKQTKEENDLVKKGGPLIKAIDKLSKTGIGQIIDKGRKDVENWAVKQGTGGKTLDELEKEAHDAIKSFGKDTNTSPKEEINSYTPSQEKPYKPDPQKTTTAPAPSEKVWDPTILKDAIQNVLSLDKNKIISLFQNKLNDDGQPYDLYDTESIEWKTGSFTAPLRREALVKFYDNNQCHASSASEVWLLRHRNGKWETDRKLAENDYTEFETVDIQRDGRLEVLIKGGGGNQGYNTTSDSLISIDERTISVLYSNEGWNHIGAGEEGEALKEYTLQFKDLDKARTYKSGVLKIIETEKTETYAWTGKKQDFENYKKTSSKSIETIYELQGDKYVKIKSLEKQVYGDYIVNKLILAYHKCKEYAIDAPKSCKNAYDIILNFLKDTASTVTGFFTGKDYIEYNVKKGDTLSGIAKDKTGDWRNWEEIMKYNKRHDDRNFNENLTIGAKVFIPKYMLKK